MSTWNYPALKVPAGLKYVSTMRDGLRSRDVGHGSLEPPQVEKG